MYILERNIARWEKIDALLYRGIKSLLLIGATIVACDVIWKGLAFLGGI